MTVKVKMNKVKSTTIASIGWRESLLYVRFVKGGLYDYRNVPETIFHQLMGANIANERTADKVMSVGSLFHHLVRKYPTLYPHTKLED